MHFNRKKYWGGFHTSSKTFQDINGETIKRKCRFIPYIHVGKCSHGTARQIRVSWLWSFAYIVRRNNP